MQFSDAKTCIAKVLKAVGEEGEGAGQSASSRSEAYLSRANY